LAVGASHLFDSLRHFNWDTLPDATVAGRNAAHSFDIGDYNWPNVIRLPLSDRLQSWVYFMNAARGGKRRGYCLRFLWAGTSIGCQE